MMKLYSLMLDKDATMVEINPMVEALDPAGSKRGVCVCVCVCVCDGEV